eukprot:scaffold1853_cov287-Chaetoceros_neogracile.AAC.4
MLLLVSEDQCGADCHNIGASMTAITSGDDHDLCRLIDELASFAGSYESESIEGVTSLGISKSTASIDGAKCKAVVIPTSSVVTITDVDDDKSLMSAVVLVPSLLLACVLFATMLFLRRRRNRIADEEQERMLRPLREDEVEDDDIYGNRKYALNAVNVHKCHSAQCNSCNDSSKSTEFIPLENVSKWIEQRGEMKEEERNGRRQKLETSRIIEDAKRVLRGDRTDQVEADRRNDKLRGLPTVPEASDMLLGDQTDQVDADRRDDKLRGLPTVLEASDSDDTDNGSRRKAS